MPNERRWTNAKKSGLSFTRKGYSQRVVRVFVDGECFPSNAPLGTIYAQLVSPLWPLVRVSRGGQHCWTVAVMVLCCVPGLAGRQVLQVHDVAHVRAQQRATRAGAVRPI